MLSALNNSSTSLSIFRIYMRRSSLYLGGGLVRSEYLKVCRQRGNFFFVASFFVLCYPEGAF